MPPDHAKGLATAPTVSKPHDTPNRKPGNIKTNTRKPRLQFLAGRLHALGPNPLYHVLDEVESGAPIRPTLETYASLPADLIAAYGGDCFGPIAFPLIGGRR